MSKRTKHKIHWTPIIIVILLIVAGAVGFYFYQKTQTKIEILKIQQETEKLAWQQTLEKQKEAEKIKLEEAEQQRKAEAYEQQKDKVLEEYPRYIKTIEESKLREFFDKYNVAQDLNERIKAATDYAKEYQFVKQHIINYIEFLDEKGEILEDWIFVDVFEERKAAQDLMILYEQNIETMKKQIEQLAVQKEAQTQAEQNALATLLKLFLGLGF